MSDLLDMNASTNSHEPFRRREALLLVVTCLLIFGMRLPWISAGFGSDPDAYRVVNAAREIAQTGRYVRSRPPGFPVYEGLIAVTSAWKSPLLSNALTAFASCVASFFFALILRQFEIRPYLVLTAAFAMTPVVYVNSVNTMDYIFALALMLCSTYCVLANRPLVAGIFLGVAIGCRVTSGVMLIPLGIWILFDRTPQVLKRLLTFVILSIAIGLASYVPVVVRYGGDLFGIYRNAEFTLDALYWTLVLGVWGELASLGLVGLACLIPFNVPHIKSRLAQFSVRRGLALSLSIAVLYFALFLAVPDETAYLMPAVPFSLLALALIMPPRLVTCFAVLLCISPFISIGDQMGVTTVGPIVFDHVNRERRVHELADVVDRVAHLPKPSVIVAGWNEPQITAIASDALRERHQFVYLIDSVQTYKRFVAEDRPVYYLPKIDDYSLQRNRVDLRRLGAKPLDQADEH